MALTREYRLGLLNRAQVANSLATIVENTPERVIRTEVKGQGTDNVCLFVTVEEELS